MWAYTRNSRLKITLTDAMNVRGKGTAAPARQSHHATTCDHSDEMMRGQEGGGTGGGSRVQNSAGINRHRTRRDSGEWHAAPWSHTTAAKPSSMATLQTGAPHPTQPHVHTDVGNSSSLLIWPSTHVISKSTYSRAVTCAFPAPQPWQRRVVFTRQLRCYTRVDNGDEAAAAHDGRVPSSAP